MMEGNARGKLIRQKFIDIEKMYHRVTSNIPRDDKSPAIKHYAEAKELSSHVIELATMYGMPQQYAISRAVEIVRRKLGHELGMELREMLIEGGGAVMKDAGLNPTRVGEALGLRPVAVNTHLENTGRQVKIPTPAGSKPYKWELTEKGKADGGY